MVGAMNFSNKTTYDVLTPVNVMFALEANTIITKEVLAQINREHYSLYQISYQVSWIKV